MDSTITLLVVNIVVIILFAVVLVFVIYTYQQNVNLIKKQREDINKLVLYIRYFDSILISIIQSVKDNQSSIELIQEYNAKINNITDLDEFKKLSPELKAKYKKYVVDRVMVSFMNLANTTVVTDERFQNYADKIISNLTDQEVSV